MLPHQFHGYHIVNVDGAAAGGGDLTDGGHDVAADMHEAGDPPLLGSLYHGLCIRGYKFRIAGRRDHTGRGGAFSDPDSLCAQSDQLIQPVDGIPDPLFDGFLQPVRVVIHHDQHIFQAHHEYQLGVRSGDAWHD